MLLEALTGLKGYKS